MGKEGYTITVTHNNKKQVVTHPVIKDLLEALADMGKPMKFSDGGVYGKKQTFTNVEDLGTAIGRVSDLEVVLIDENSDNKG